nr:hypothetical protein BaRGS_027572 [Batillaria attramentaria]
MVVVVVRPAVSLTDLSLAVRDKVGQVKIAPPESNDADSGHETDTNLAAPLLVATAAGVAAGAVVGAGVVATTMAAEPPPKKKAAKKVAIQPVSDFDDYKSMRPKMLPDPDFHSSPPPARYSDPPPGQDVA